MSYFGNFKISDAAIFNYSMGRCIFYIHGNYKPDLVVNIAIEYSQASIPNNVLVLICYTVFNSVQIKAAHFIDWSNNFSEKLFDQLSRVL